MTRGRCAALALLVAAAALPAGAAPPPSPPAVSPDPLKAPFEALPEGERRAIQADLIWIADFTGAATGGYGPRTRDALLASARRLGLPPSAVVEGTGRARLAAEADAARRAVGFAVVRDPRTGIAVGIPSKLAPVRSVVPDGTRYAAPDGSFTIELTARPNAGPAGLADALARLTRDASGRRVTYSLVKPDFVVVSGETGEAAFYARMALAPSAPVGSAPALRGFVVNHPKADRSGAVALAVAASFDPFPPPAVAPPAAAPPVPAFVLAGQAVLVGPDLALTRIGPDRCADPEVDGAPVRWARQDPGTGLALLRLSDHADVRPIPLAGRHDAPRLVLFLVPGDEAPSLTAAATSEASGDGVSAPLQGADAGAVLLDGTGALAGLTAPRGGRRVSVAGVTAEARYGFAGAGPIAAFLKDAGVLAAPAGGTADPGEAVARWRFVILPLRCRAG